MDKQTTLAENMPDCTREQRILMALAKLSSIYCIKIDISTFWPRYRTAAEMPGAMLQNVEDNLAKELRAAELLGERAAELVTMRDKLLSYFEAVNRILSRTPAATLDNPMQWISFKALISHEVQRGRQADDKKIDLDKTRSACDDCIIKYIKELGIK